MCSIPVRSICTYTLYYIIRCVAETWLIRLGSNLLSWTTITIYREGKLLQSLEINCFIESKYRKQSKKWDALPAMNRKMHDYIPTIMRAIVEKRISASITLKHSVVVPEDHPTRIQNTIAHVPPTATHDIIRNKRSRFT